MASDAPSSAPNDPAPFVPGPAGGGLAAAAPNVTDLLVAWSGGDAAALDALMPIVYAELRRQASRAMRRESTGHTLDATGLVHEAYLRLVDQQRIAWRNRAQFYGVAAQLMRRVLVDHARERGAAKRGGGLQRVTLDGAAAMVADDGSASGAADVVAVHEALERLAALDAEQARVVELRYFGGLSIEETAAVLGISPSTVKREWVVARAWLLRELGAR